MEKGGAAGADGSQRPRAARSAGSRVSRPRDRGPTLARGAGARRPERRTRRDANTVVGGVRDPPDAPVPEVPLRRRVTRTLVAGAVGGPTSHDAVAATPTMHPGLSVSENPVIVVVAHARSPPRRPTGRHRPAGRSRWGEGASSVPARPRVVEEVAEAMIHTAPITGEGAIRILLQLARELLIT